MTTIYFVRHAEPNFSNHDDLTRELSPKGRQDTALVERYFSDKDISAVLSSPFRRAVDTVRGVAEARGMDVELIDDFRERRVDSGWIDDFNSFCHAQWSNFEYKLIDGECLREVQERNIAALRQVLTRYSGRTVVIGSHGTALSTIINYFDRSFGHSEFEAIRALMPWVVRFDFSGDCCSCIEKIDLFQIYDQQNNI